MGAHSVIMYGVTIADNVFVASGSVVTKSIIESNVIVAGCLARVIGTWDEFKEKTKDKVMKLGNKNYEEKRNYILTHSEKLIVR